MAFLALSNIIGVKSAGRTNDVLTIVKLVPLVLFSAVCLGFVVLNPSIAQGNYTPMFPLGFSNFGSALVLIFWAYAGFEIAAIPADEIKNPGKTIPRAISVGIIIVIIFYLITNGLLFAVTPWEQLAVDPTPLTSTMQRILGGYPTIALIASSVIGIGALVSIAGSDESGMLGTSKLGYALSADGLFPKAFSKLHSRFKTPYLGIIIQSVTALVASLIGQLDTLVATAVFLLAVGYAATSASIFFLKKKNINPEFRLRGGSIIAALGVIFSIYLIAQCSTTQIIIGITLLLIGVPIYIKFTPKKELAEVKVVLLSREARLEAALHQEHNFLAHPLYHIKKAYRRRKSS